MWSVVLNRFVIGGVDQLGTLWKEGCWLVICPNVCAVTEKGATEAAKCQWLGLRPKIDVRAGMPCAGTSTIWERRCEGEAEEIARRPHSAADGASAAGD